MATTITEEQIGLLPPGSEVTVTREQDGYMVRGRFVGLMFQVNGPLIRVMGEDRLERRVPLPAKVTVHVR